MQLRVFRKFKSDRPVRIDRPMGDRVDTLGGDALAQVSHSVIEFAQGIPLVKVFGQQGRAHHAYRVAVDNFMAFFLGWVRPLMKPETLSALVIAPFTLLLVALAFGTLAVSQGWLEVSQLLPFAVLGLGISVPVSALSRGAHLLQLSKGALARLGGFSASRNRRTPSRGSNRTAAKSGLKVLRFHSTDHAGF